MFKLQFPVDSKHRMRFCLCRRSQQRLPNINLEATESFCYENGIKVIFFLLNGTRSEIYSVLYDKRRKMVLDFNLLTFDYRYEQERH